MTSKLLIFVIFSSLLICCSDHKNKLDDQTIIIKDLSAGLRECTVMSNGKILFKYFLDKKNDIVEISNRINETPFKIGFYKHFKIGYFENNQIKTWIDEESNKIKIVKNKGKIEKELTLYNLNDIPYLDYTEDYVHDGIKYLSQFKSYDLNTCKEKFPEDTEAIILTKRPIKISYYNSNVWSFKIKSNLNRHILLLADWDENFEPTSKIDSISIKNTFTITSAPTLQSNFLRFKILSEDSKTKMFKTFYYQLDL